MESPLSLNTDNVITVFFQGMMSSRSQAAKYTSQGIKIDGKIDGKIVYIPNAPDIIYNPYIYDELWDVNYNWTLNPIDLVFKVMSYVKGWYYNIHNEPVYHINLANLNVGGREDILQCQSAIRSCIASHPDKKLVLFGCSRGASTILSSLSSLYDIEQIKPHIGLIILEGPFDSVDNVLLQRSYFPGFQLFLLNNFTGYNKEFPPPLHFVTDKFPLDIPLAFISSKVDTVVPPQCTQNIIDILRQRGHKHLHHLSLHNSPHSEMSLHNTEDKSRYINFVNALYTRYLQ